MTDVNLLLGLLPGKSLGYGSIVIDRSAAESALRALAEQLDNSLYELTFGAWRIVNATMAQAIREITVYKGIDPRDFSLFCFGSAAAQHAVEVSRELRIGRVIIPAAASVFSGLGLLSARLEIFGSCSVDATLGRLFEDAAALDRVLKLEEDLLAERRADSFVGRSWILECRHVGQTHTLEIPFDPVTDGEPALRERFLSEHSRLYGVRGETDIEVVNARLAIASSDPKFDSWRPAKPVNGAATFAPDQDVWMEKDSVQIIPRIGLDPGEEGVGPALIADPSSTIYIPSESRWSIDNFGSIVIEISP